MANPDPRDAIADDAADLGDNTEGDRVSFQKSLVIVLTPILVFAAAVLFLVPRPDPDGLSTSEVVSRDSMMDSLSISKEQATNVIIGNRVAPEEARRREFDRAQRQRDVEAIAAEACATQPWMDSCR